MKSVWESTVAASKFESLKKNINTDVLIIGGGMAGILTAYMLKESGTDCVLAEAKTICSGITKNTTAKITSQHGLIYDKLIRTVGEEKARQYLVANEAALKKYFELCQSIDCDFEKKDAFVYSLNDSKKIEAEIKALEKLKFKTQFIKETALPFKIAGAIKFNGQAQFNPLKFASSVAKNLTVFENTPVRELVGTTAICDHGKINAQKIVVATHFPLINKHGSYFLKLYQHRSYVMAFSGAKALDGMYVDEAQSGMSFRNYKDLLFIGGGDHRTGKSGGNFSELESFKNKYYKDSREKYRWATQDCMSLDGVPYIGNYSKNAENMYVATGFNKWGMTSSMAAAMILTDMITKGKSSVSEVFSPSRTILHGQLFVNAFEATINLLTPFSHRCPHLGCALKWNRVERTWDCPCHGSRFTENGNLIDNPATNDINI